MTLADGKNEVTAGGIDPALGRNCLCSRTLLGFSFRELWHRQVFDRSSASGAVVAPLEATPSSSPLMRTTGLLVMSPLISPSASREEATITPSTGGIPE